jgi:hypothetical protein
MARESKDERVVRQMSDAVTEHLHQLQNISKNVMAKELDVERWAESVIRNCLGYSASNGFSIRAQDVKGKSRPDLIVYKGDKPAFVVEVKKLEFNLDRTTLRSGKVQLREYLASLDGVRWGFLCNGYEWRLFDFGAGGVEIQSFDLRGETESLEVTKKAVEEVSWSFLDFHLTSFESNYWQELSKEATAFSPDSLARAILSADVIRDISKHIRGEHEYRANLDILTDKLAALVEHGLNDQMPDWNEAKQSEIQKYIKSQKRALRKKKRVKQDRKEVETTSAPNEVGTSDVTLPEANGQAS